MSWGAGILGEVLRIGGGRKSYTSYHVIKLLQALKDQGPLGRPLISRVLGIGEGASRSLVKELRRMGVVETDAVGGSYLTEKGSEILRMWMDFVENVACVEGPLDPSPWRIHAIACVPWKFSPAVVGGSTLGLRDRLVRRGCDGALILGLLKGSVYLLDSRGQPDLDVGPTPLGGKVASVCRGAEMLVIAGSSSSCRSAEKCVVEALAEAYLTSAGDRFRP